MIDLTCYMIEPRKERILLCAKYRITETTLVLWRFLVKYNDRCGYAPSMREMAEGCYLSISAVGRHLNYLQDRGYITRPPEQAARAIRLNVRPE